VVRRQSKSALPSPLKSPVPISDQAGSALATGPPPTICPPFISQLVTAPFVRRHRMSAIPSPLKSPCASGLSTTVHSEGTVVETRSNPTPCPVLLSQKTQTPVLPAPLSSRMPPAPVQTKPQLPLVSWLLPATCPASLMLSATLLGPPKVPRSTRF